MSQWGRQFYSTASGVHCFTSAGSEVEVKDQQIQTEISETAAEHKHMQAGSVTSPPTSMCWSGVYTSNLWQLYTNLLSNGIIDTSTQKGFLSGVNGTFEHIYSINAILDNAKAHNLPLAMTFIDLKNAFGNWKCFTPIHPWPPYYVKVPSEVRYYIHNLYSNLFAFVSTKSWSTSIFPIQRGVFQGDTLSPLIFLLCFNPIVMLAKKLKGASPSTYPSPTPRIYLLLDRTFMLNGKKPIRQIPMGFIFALLWNTIQTGPPQSST